MVRLFRVLRLGGAILLSILAATAPSRAEVPHIRNAESARGPRTVYLEEIWRVGGEESGLIFGTVTEAAADTVGNVYLLDTQLLHVEVISPTGEHLRTLSREGDGPGEVRRPRDVILLPDGNVGLLELFPAKLVKLTPLGQPRETMLIGGEEASAGGFTAASHCISRGGTLLLAGQRTAQSQTGQRRDMFLCRLSERGEELVRYREATMTLDFQKLHFVERELQPSFHLASAVGPDGRVYVPQAWERYAIEVFHPDGTLQQVIERAFENRKRSAEELRRINALFDASDRNIPYEVTREIEPCNPAIAALHVDANGNLWVQHNRSGEGQPTGIMLTFDLFDPAGRYLQEVAIACEGDPEYDGLEFLPDGRVLLIKGYVLAGMARTDLGSVPLGEEEESSPMEIICCRMVG